MSWKLRWAGWNKGMKRYTKSDGSYGYAYPPLGGLVNWLGNRKKVNEELKKTVNMNPILNGNGELIEMPKSIVKKKLLEWAETERIFIKYWRDTEDARESGDPSDLDGYLFSEWTKWKKLQGYK